MLNRIGTIKLERVFYFLCFLGILSSFPKLGAQEIQSAKGSAKQCEQVEPTNKPIETQWVPGVGFDSYSPIDTVLGHSMLFNPAYTIGIILENGKRIYQIDSIMFLDYTDHWKTLWFQVNHNIFSFSVRQ